MLQICHNIRQARLSKGKSQQEIADYGGYKRDSYKNWEIATEPDLSTIKTIAEAIGVPAFKLLDGIIDFTEKDEIEKQIQITINISDRELARIKSNLSVLDSIFSTEPDLKKYKRPDVESSKIGGSKKPRLLKPDESKQRGND